MITLYIFAIFVLFLKEFFFLSIIYPLSNISFFTAGADVVVTATYQASIDGFVKQYKMSEDEAKTVIQDLIKLAQRSRDEAAQVTGKRLDLVSNKQQNI